MIFEALFLLNHKLKKHAWLNVKSISHHPTTKAHQNCFNCELFFVSQLSIYGPYCEFKKKTKPFELTLIYFTTCSFLKYANTLI